MSDATWFLLGFVVASLYWFFALRKSVENIRRYAMGAYERGVRDGRLVEREEIRAVFGLSSRTAVALGLAPLRELGQAKEEQHG